MKAQLLATLENSKQYTLQVAGKMPEPGYASKPTPAVWNFGELLHHIAYGIEWWQENFIKGIETAWAPPAATTGKKAVHSYLEQAYDALKATIENTTLTEEAVKGFHATMDHITHHRGQAVTYLRCEGIEPPEYRY
ncbi:MAG TPA: DinB family protein [Chitinophaga sp.]|uniref:DinB family protein n=1 Tax=Chitinophaga sp. TaxID=1869181 RepID=UPI002DBE5E8D|nr:DinB family protein [Chitinophaga sp.]HEU4553639.1 DinB family protein [Chitinophaga sp.]